MAQYRPIDDLTVEQLERVLKLLKEEGISPFNLFAFAVAKDCIEEAQEYTDEGDEEMTPMEVVELRRDADVFREDAEDNQWNLLDAAEKFLGKMG
jgi:hypothetical protein